MSFAPRGPGGRRDWRGVYVALGMIGAVATALYPIFIYPYFHIEEYQKVQKINREQIGMPREAIQPGNMRVWSDPFEQRKD